MGGFGSGVRVTKKSTVEQSIGISIADLRVRALGPGSVRTGSFVWTSRNEDAPSSSIRYATALNAEMGLLLLLYSTGGEAVDHEIKLVATRPHFGGRRWWFVCPKTGKRTTKVYLPPGGRRFFSREAHDLTYNSSQESGKYDGLLSRVAERLGTDVKAVRVALRRAANDTLEATKAEYTTR